MLSKQADFTWEYTGTAWITYLGNAEGIPDKREQYDAVREADAANGLTWGEPAPLNNTYAMAASREVATPQRSPLAAMKAMAARTSSSAAGCRLASPVTRR